MINLGFNHLNIDSDSDSEYFIDSNFTKFMVIYKYTRKKNICVYQGKNGFNIVFGGHTALSY